MHALEKEMAPHSSILDWRIPGTEEPGGLPSMGSHRVGRDWSDLAAAALLTRNSWRSAELQRKEAQTSLLSDCNSKDYVLLFSRSVVSNSFRFPGVQNAKLLYPSLSPGVCFNLCSSDHCYFCRKPDPGAAPVQRLPLWTNRLCSLRGERPLLLRWGSYRTVGTSHPLPPTTHTGSGHLPGHRPIVPFLSPQTADSSAWWTGAVAAPGEWRSLTRAPGAPSVMTAGTWMMPTWCAGSWAVEKPSMPRDLLTSGQDQGPSGWMTWTAEEMSPTCGGALPGAGGSMTADTSRTRGSSAQVCAAHCPQAGGGAGPWKTGFWALRERCRKDQRRRLPPMEPVFPADVKMRCFHFLL